MTNKTTFYEIIEAVELFHEIFGIKNATEVTADPEFTEFQLRYDLMKEENEEYLEAAKNGNIVEIADALGDQLYILCGTILKHGLQDKIVEIFAEIQRSNMSKLDADGNPIYREDGKILKSELYSKPDISKILSENSTSIKEYEACIFDSKCIVRAKSSNKQFLGHKIESKIYFKGETTKDEISYRDEELTLNIGDIVTHFKKEINIIVLELVGFENFSNK